MTGSRRRVTGGQAGTVLILTAVWVALWQELSPANVLAGLAVALVLQVAVPSPVGSADRYAVVRPVAAARFLVHFALLLLKAAAVVAWEIITPRIHDRPGIVGVRLTSRSPTIVTIVSNAVTLTPGTVTVEASTDPPELVLHVLHARDPEAIRREVLHLESLAIAAFGVEPPTGSPAQAPSSGPRPAEPPP